MKTLQRILLCFAGLIALALLVLLALHKNVSIKTEISINSSPERVWNVLTAASEYPSWNPMISRLAGDLREGNVVEVTIGIGSNQMTFRPTILRVQTGQELRWKGMVLIPGLFDGEHRFLLEKQGEGTHFIQGEDFSGLFVGKLTAGLLRDTKSQMDAMNRALKQRSETQSNGAVPSSKPFARP